MKIVGILSAYDESASWLAASITGFAKVCDAIVYADGSYGLYPGARPRSHPEQAEAVIQTCEAADVECIVHRPKDVYWGNEVEKRNKTFQLAGALDPDWVLVFDGDYMLIRSEPEQVRKELEKTDLNVATYTLLDGMDALSPNQNPDFAVNMPLSTEWTYRTRDIYRWTPDLRYGPAHFTIRGTYDGEVCWIRGPELLQSTVPIADAHHLEASLVAVHRTQHRARVRREAAQEYYRLRDIAAVETISDVNWAETAT